MGFLLRSSCCGLLIVALACHRPAYTYQKPPTEPATPPAASAGQPLLVFLTFKAQASDAGPLRVQLLDAKTVAGTLKPPLEPSFGANYLIVDQLDAQQRVLSSATVEHPLLREVEYPVEGGTLARKFVRLPEAEFFVRLARPPQAATVRVTEMLNRQPAATLDFVLPTKP